VFLFGKEDRHGTTDIPGTAGDQYLHKKHCPFVNSLGNLESITVGSSQTDPTPPLGGFRNGW
jgi:hypothetical protein